ncbi:MAG: iron-sulfur cluster assembly accessory protein [Gammaproteobacteria bacterium]|nr:MAG: iron-sulfur cluster assembly accessory protein [Gammaproteobacteria bacterium]
MSISLTEKAAARVRDYLGRNRDAVGLRLGVRKSGCSGLAYTVDFADAIGPDDVVVEAQGIRLIVAADSLPIFQGARIDFVRDGLNEKFAFENPNVTGQCGCGGSFSVQ